MTFCAESRSITGTWSCFASKTIQHNTIEVCFLASGPTLSSLQSSFGPCEEKKKVWTTLNAKSKNKTEAVVKQNKTAVINRKYMFFLNNKRS